jgi:hypothetical protein
MPPAGPTGTSEPGRFGMALVGWCGIARYRRGGPRREVGLNASGADAFLLAGQQGCRFVQVPVGPWGLTGPLG